MRGTIVHPTIIVSPLIIYKGRLESTLQEVLFPQPDISFTLSIQRYGSILILPNKLTTKLHIKLLTMYSLPYRVAWGHPYQSTPSPPPYPPHI